MSEEGVLLFVRRLTMSSEDWVKLTSVVSELGQLRGPLSSVSNKAQSDRLPQPVLLRAGWLYRRRRRILRSVCCTTEQHRDELLNVCQQKLSQYR